jgi:hypothetical protein
MLKVSTEAGLGLGVRRISTALPIQIGAARRRRSAFLGLLVAAAAIAGTLAATGQPGGRELLNSERIAARFGSYGLEVLDSSAGARVSNLYSSEAEGRVCRTFAIVRYPNDIAPELAAPHAAILAGGSMGATLLAAGWQVRKRHLYFGEVAATATVAALMHVAPGTPLAEHAYVLDVEKDGRVLPYAALVEIHHPDYLGESDLTAIYGMPSGAGREALLKSLLDMAAVRAAAP